MHILFITSQLPYPPYSGGVIKSWMLVQHWAEKYELSVVSLLKGEDPQHEENFLKKVSLHNYYSEAINKPRSGINFLRSYLSGSASLNIYRNYSSSIAKAVEEISATADIIVADHYEMGQYVPADFSGKVVLHEHNAEYIMWERLAELEKNPVKKWLISAESRRIKAAEYQYGSRADLILASPNDIKELTAIGLPVEKFRTTYHLGDDYLLAEPQLNFAGTKCQILFIGTLTWEANIDGLEWFVTKCWPQILQKEPKATFKIVGKNPGSRLTALAERYSGISFTGFAEELEPFYLESRAFVVPLRFGSGIKVKLLNAMYRGIPVVTTPIGTEGLEVENGQHLFSTQDPGQYAQYVLQLLRDEPIWKKLSTNSRQLVGSSYTWKKLLQHHDRELEKLIGHSSTNLTTLKNAI